MAGAKIIDREPEALQPEPGENLKRSWIECWRERVRAESLTPGQTVR